MLIDSHPESGSINLTPDGSQFQVPFSEAFLIPANAININVTVPEAQVYNTAPNVIKGVNDTLYFQGLPGPVNTTVVLPPGLYDIPLINAELARQGVTTYSFTEDDATQKVVFNNNSGLISLVLFTGAHSNSPWFIMGAWSGTRSNPAPVDIGTPAGVPPGGNQTFPQVATFNLVNKFLIHSDLVQRGIRLNGGFSQIITDVPIEVPPGSQITYSPPIPASSPANELAGAPRNILRFWLTDNTNNYVNTNGEFWSARLSIHFDEPVV
jgi:hypothetical protein